MVPTSVGESHSDDQDPYQPSAAYSAMVAPPPAKLARRLSRIEAVLLGLDDAATFVRPWAALHAVQRGACAKARRRIAQHTEIVHQADAAVLANTLAVIRTDVRGTATLQPVDSVTMACRACGEQLEQQHALLDAASEDQALAAQSEQRITDMAARMSSDRTARSDALWAAAKQAGSLAAEQAAQTRREMQAAAAQVAHVREERCARVAAALAGAEQQLAAETAFMTSGQERLRAAVGSARELCRQREKAHVAALNRLRQPVVAAVSEMKRTTATGKLQAQREQLEQETRSVQHQSLVQHLCWLRQSSDLLSDGVRTIGAHLHAVEAARRGQVPLRGDSERLATRVEALSARVEQLQAA